MNAPAPYRPLSAVDTPRGVPASQATTIEQSRAIAEVQAAVVVAQNVPRDIARAEAEMRDACGRLAMAEQAFYQVPNRGNGASVHLMRELARIWGNVKYGVQELARDDYKGESEIQAYAWDVQTNSRTDRTFIVPHARMKEKQRQQLTDLGDIQNNNNNVGARAVRECISNVLPRWFTELAQTVCRQTLEHGEGVPLKDRIERMIAAFDGIGVSQQQMETKLAKKRGQWDAGDVAQMGIVYTSITRDGLDKNEAFEPAASITAEEIVGDRDKPAKKAPAKKAAKKAAPREKSWREAMSDKMHALFGKVDLGPKDKQRENRLLVTEALTDRAVGSLKSSSDLTNDELGTLVDILEADDKQGALDKRVGDILARASLTDEGDEQQGRLV